MPSSYLIVDLMARGLYRNPVPPDPLEAVLTADPRFVDAGFSSFMLAEDLTPEMESTIRRRKEALPELFGPVEPSAEIPDSDGDESPAMPARESLERMMADIMEVVSQQQFGSIEEANAFLQDLLAKGGPPRRRAETPLQRAQDLMYDAREATGARRVKLARQALQISPDCADAYVLLAEETARTPSEALNIYAQGVAAGERALGPRAFKEDVGHFWGILETRPYMRARLGLAECLWSVGRREEAIAHYWEMLRLNPGDNQGVRYLLVSILLEEGRDADLKKLFRQYREDASAAWLYGRALHAFRTQGANPAAKKLLATARWSNPHVPAYLVGKKRIPRQLPEYMGLGDESEAIHCAVQQRRAWQRTPGALDWLQGQSR